MVIAVVLAVFFVVRKRLVNARTEIKKRDDIIIKKQKAIERADKENKRVPKTLEEISRKHGIYEVDNQRNLLIA